MVCLEPTRLIRSLMRVLLASDRALVNPPALVSWLPPAGVTGLIERFDLRPGGDFRMVLTYVDDSTTTGKAPADSYIVEPDSFNIVLGNESPSRFAWVSDDW